MGSPLANPETSPPRWWWRACSPPPPPHSQPQGDLDHYRNVENIWTFYLKNAVIKLENVEHRVDDRLRIIACDGRTPSAGAGAGKKAKK